MREMYKKIKEIFKKLMNIEKVPDFFERKNKIKTYEKVKIFFLK